jgi:SRSO17 transposase
MIRRAKANHLPFAVVTADSLYGRNGDFRASLAQAEIRYLLDIPADYPVYLDKPVVGVPETPPNKKGRPFSRWQVLNQVKPVEVRTLTGHTDLQPIEIRHAERGCLIYQCAARRIWTITTDGLVRPEWLLIWHGPDDKTARFSLSNAASDIFLHTLARWRALRYFAERIFQDSKSEAGWDELVARKYRAWMHHTALDALALWFAATIKLDWSQAHPRDPALSMVNIQELLKAVLPLKQLSPDQAQRLVIKHLVNRTRSTRTRLKRQLRTRAPI